jgi:5'-nucleotidase
LIRCGKETPMRRFAVWVVSGCLIAGAGLFGGCTDGGGGGGAAEAYDLGGPAALVDGSFDYDLTIAFTNDLHDQVLPIANGRGGLARQATLMRLLRQEAAARGKQMLALNAGDNFEGTLFYDTDGGVILFRTLELIGYDACQIGNHDHQFGAQRLYSRLETAFPGFAQGMKLSWGNVNPSHMSPIGTDPAQAGAAFLPAQVDQAVIDAFENAFVNFTTGAVDPSLMDSPLANSKVFNQTLFFERGGIRIGLFGMDTDEALYASVPGEGDLFLNADGLAENLRFYEPATSTYASDMISYLNDPDGNAATDDGADVIIALTHVGLDVDTQIAANAAGVTGRRIDVIVGGHSHTKLNTNVDVVHGDGSRTVIVQAGSRGEYVGRLDLAVDRALDKVSVRACGLLQVDDRLAADPGVTALIQGELTRPGGVNDTHAAPFATVIAQNAAFLPGGVPAASALGSLAADAVRSVANAPPHSLALDAVLVGNFVFRADVEAGPVTAADVHAALPLHVLDRSGATPDGIDVIEFAGGPREALDPSSFPIPGPNLTQITQIEYFLEVAFSIQDILALLANFLGFSISGIDDFINGLQWSGIHFTVDTQAPPMQRIDPATIVIGGMPLIGNENQAVRLGISSVLARVAVPFFQILTMIEEPPGSLTFVPFPSYDPVTAATNVVTWSALRDHVQALGVLSGGLVRVSADRPRTLAPDLTFNPADALITPALAASGEAATLALPILNIGASGTLSAQLTLFMDTTPLRHDDDPDGITDMATGFAFTSVGGAAIGPIPGAGGTVAGSTPASLLVQVPSGLAPGDYPLYLTISSVTPELGFGPETVTANNGGLVLPIFLRVR